MVVSDSIGPNSRFAFLHIPKTAGSTVLSFLREIFGSESVWIHGENFNVRAAPGLVPGHVRVIGGHFSIRQIHRMLPGDFHYMSIIRDPAERIVSYHQHILATAGHELQPDLPFREINADLKASEPFRSHVRDQQVRFLSLDGKAASVRQLCERGALSLATIGEADAFLHEIAARVGVSCGQPGKLNVGSTMKPTLTATSDWIIEGITTEDRDLFNYVAQSHGSLTVVRAARDDLSQAGP